MKFQRKIKRRASQPNFMEGKNMFRDKNLSKFKRQSRANVIEPLKREKLCRKERENIRGKEKETTS